MTDYKEYAKQMRENAVKNEQGNVVCSPELWDEIASVIERAIVPPCKVGQTVYYIAGKKVYKSKCHAITQHKNGLQIHLYDYDGDNVKETTSGVYRPIFVDEKKWKEMLGEYNVD